MKVPQIWVNAEPGKIQYAQCTPEFFFNTTQSSESELETTFIQNI